MNVGPGIFDVLVAVVGGIFTVVVTVLTMKLRKTNTNVRELETNVSDRITVRMEEQLRQITADWIAAQDEKSALQIEVVWLRESLQKAHRDLAYFGRRKGDI